jgi:hypothetical protein
MAEAAGVEGRLVAFLDKPGDGNPKRERGTISSLRHPSLTHRVTIPASQPQFLAATKYLRSVQAELTGSRSRQMGDSNCRL